MPPVLVLIHLILHLHVIGPSAATDTVSPDRPLVGHDRLVSSNGKFALGFFQAGGSSDSSSSPNAASSGLVYLAIWFYQVPKIAPVWVANSDDPFTEPNTWRLAISGDGNLIIASATVNYSTVRWSTRANTKTSDTVAVLLNNGNLVLLEASNSSNVLWQSFDHPTDTVISGGKIGWSKVTGLSRRLVSRKNLISQATGEYYGGFDDTGGSHQLVIAPLKKPSTPYWYSGEWNGEYFNLLPEMRSVYKFNFTYIDDEEEEYCMFTVEDETVILRHVLDVSGQAKTLTWNSGSQDWTEHYSKPNLPCDVYATCGAFTNCDDNALPYCSCMKGFSIRSTEDWDLDDRTGGCIRKTPLDCSTSTNKIAVSSTDKFYSIPCVRLPQNAQMIGPAGTALECAQACLSNCSCTAYSYGNTGCLIWHNELINVKQQQCSRRNSQRSAAAELQVEQHKKGKATRVMIGASLGVLGFSALILMLVLLIRSKMVGSGRRLNNTETAGGTITAFRYVHLQSVTNNFSEKIGGGSFGSVFKGVLANSTTIAVKRLDSARQGEKQFRAEVSSVGTVQHINLVKLIGFCCERDKRLLLVYEYMPNSSDVHLFRSNNAVILGWSVRYEIALGIARGLAYLHESCRDCIIHCDIKPENILLDESFIPKIAVLGWQNFWAEISAGS